MKDVVTNAERLKQNQEVSQKVIKIYIADPGQAAGKTEEELKEDISNAIKGGVGDDHLNLIELVEELRDLKQGIKWARSEKHSDGTQTLIRDAREQSGQVPIDSPESYLIQTINASYAALKIIPSEKKVEAQKALDEIIQSVFNLSQKGEKIKIKAVNKAIVDIAKRNGVVNPEEKIAAAMQFTNLERQQYHVATISQQGTETIIEVDNMMLGLTPLQQAQYIAIHQAEKGAKVNLNFEGKEVDMEWYNQLPRFQKDLVKQNAFEFAKGDKVLPTQLRKSMVGLRNAHSKSVYIESSDNKGNLQLVQQTLHAGTISFHGKGDKQLVADENAKQAETFLEKGKHLNIVVLNSPANPTGIDKSIHEQVGKSQQKTNGQRTTTPFNIWRRFSGNDNTGFNKTLTAVGNSFIDSYPEIAKFLKTNKGESAAFTQLDEIPEKDLKDALRHALEAKKLMNKWTFLFDSENRNLQLVAHMSLLDSAITHGALKDRNIQTEQVLVQCASGKDRTGLAMTHATLLAVNEDINMTDHKGTQQEILDKLVNAGHTAFMASVNGGTPGAHGIKKDTTSAFNSMYKETKGLQQNTASFNSFKVAKESFLTRIYNKIFGTVATEKVDEVQSSTINLTEEDLQKAFVKEAPNKARQINTEVVHEAQQVGKNLASSLDGAGGMPQDKLNKEIRSQIHRR